MGPRIVPNKKGLITGEDEPSPLKVSYCMKYKNYSADFNPYNLNLIEAIQRIKERSAKEDDAIGYYLPAFISTPLPHSKPSGQTYWRYNGDASMQIIPNPDFGYPYAGRSRLLIAWLISSLCRQYNVGRKSGMERNKLNNESRLIYHGHIEETLMKLGYRDASGGQNGSITLTKQHLEAIINAQFKWSMKDRHKDFTQANARFLFSMKEEIYWPNHQFDSARQSHIEITPTLLHLVQSKHKGFDPFPIDLRAFSALRESPLAMDLYCWITRKMQHILTHPRRYECLQSNDQDPDKKRKRFIYSWSSLKPQFGEGYSRTSNFANAAKKEIRKIKQLWQYREYTDSNGVVFSGLSVDFPRGRIELFPSPTHIPLPSKGRPYKVINE